MQETVCPVSTCLRTAEPHTRHGVSQKGFHTGLKQKGKSKSGASVNSTGRTASHVLGFVFIYFFKGAGPRQTSHILACVDPAGGNSAFVKWLFVMATGLAR